MRGNATLVKSVVREYYQQYIIFSEGQVILTIKL